MITIKKKVTIVSGQAPFQYQWTSSSPCLTFSKATGTVTGNSLETDFLLSNETCAATATLTITSACGNTQSFPVTYTSPCTSLQLQPIVNNKGLIFEVTASSAGCSNVNFKWSYDTKVLGFLTKVDSNFGSVLTVNLAQNITLPSNTTISVEATDCKGCVKTAVFNYAIKVPQVSPITVNLYPNKDKTTYSGEATFTFPTDTFTGTFVQSVPTILQVTKISDVKYQYNVPFNTVSQIQGNINTQTLYTQGTYTVKSMLGVTSNLGNITFIYHPSEQPKPINIFNGAFTLPCDIVSGQVYKINMSNYVSTDSSSAIDWNSFMLVSPVPKSTSVTIINEAGTQYMYYTVPTPISTDVVRFTIKTTTGVISDTATFTIVPCPPSPIANNDSFTIAANSTVTKDILINDIGNGAQIDPSTVTISNVQSGLTVVANPNGTVTITVDKNASSTRTFNYTVKSTSGKESNVATVTITVVNAGQNTNVILCD